jgi:predicted permease
VTARARPEPRRTGESKIATFLAASYLVLAALSIGYELSIRLFDRGNSEFAGMLSLGLTLPSVIAVMSIAQRAFGVRVGDSDASFVTILGLGAVANALVVFAIVKALRRAAAR